MRRVVLGCAVFLMAAASWAVPPGEIAAQVVSEAKKVVRAENIEFSEVGPMKYTASITYKKGTPVSRAVVKRDTEYVVRGVLKKLVSTGRKPSMDDIIFVTAHAQQRASGETRDGFIYHGKSMYNFNTDRIEFRDKY